MPISDFCVIFSGIPVNDTGEYSGARPPNLVAVQFGKTDGQSPSFFIATDIARINHKSGTCQLICCKCLVSIQAVCEA
jgi:hypothetical protein